MIMRQAFLAALAGGFGFSAVIAATAQVYPSRPVTMIVPSVAGGVVDTLGRIVAERIRASLGQPGIIENVGGASGIIAAGRVARAPPDGYMLVIGNWSTHVIDGAILALPYNVANDFEAISLIASNPLLIIARKSMPANDLRELIAWLKANPDKASLGTNGPGSAAHLAGLLLQKETGTRFGFVPYRGAASAQQDLAGGQIDIMIDLAANSLPQVRSGSFKAYAATAKTRLAVAPDIPTVDEAGAPGLYVSAWNGLWAPKGTPRDVIGKLNSAVVDALADPAVRQRLADLGYEIPPRDQQTPEALRAFQKAEIEKWWPFIKAAGIRAE